jgi:hypothetical protein
VKCNSRVTSSSVTEEKKKTPSNGDKTLKSFRWKVERKRKSRSNGDMTPKSLRWKTESERKTS